MLSQDEKRALSLCATPEARSALLLEWVLAELRGGTARPLPVEDAALRLPPEKRGPGRPRKVTL